MTATHRDAPPGLIPRQEPGQLRRPGAGGRSGQPPPGDPPAVRPEDYLRLVEAIARDYRAPGMDSEDLVQEGYVGLLEAARRFDTARGSGFRSFAEPRIRGAILDALRERSALIAIPRGRQAALRGAGPPSGRDEPARRAVHVRRLGTGAVASPAGRDLPDPLERDAVRRAVSALPWRHRAAIAAHYQMDGAPPMSVAATAARLGCSVSYYHLLRRQALDRLRAALTAARDRARESDSP